MKVSVNLAQHYSNVDLKSIPHDVLLARVGEQLGAVEESFEYAPKYEGVLVVKIVSVENHPDADRLHICMIDDDGKAKGVKRDSKGLVQVVCGAPNVRPGLFVAWLPPGSTVPASYNDENPFVLEARELRGIVSNGMLASAKELAINDDHSMILEIDPEEIAGDRTQKNTRIKPGDPLTNYFGLDDFIIDCENKMFTHRPDCFGNLGVARELAGISGLKFKSPSWYADEPRFESRSGVKLNVKNNVGKLVPRFMAVAVKNVEIKPSPVWLQGALARVGIKSINNVVDITNFTMHITGQPLHAYDADKLARLGNGLSLEARMSKKGEKVNLLNGKTLTFEDDKDIVITSHDVPVGLGGIMGGSDTEVDENTTSIVLECATFDMYTIRRTSMKHGLFTDASTRYTKGQSPLQNDRAVAYALTSIKNRAGGEQSSNVIDVHGKLEQPGDVVVTAQFINERLGSDLNLKEIAKLLENVEFEIKSVPADKNRLHVRPPFWRTDIEIPEDIVEEVGRLHGYHELPQTLPARSSKPSPKNAQVAYKKHIRYALRKAGANEVLAYSFVHGDLLRKTGTDPDTHAYHIRNALSPELQYYRTSLMPSLLDKVRGNIRADLIGSEDKDFALFEIGKAHLKGVLDPEKLPMELERLALVFAADDKTAKRAYEGAAFYQAKKYLEPVIPERLEFVQLTDTADPMLSCYQPGRAALVKIHGETCGVIGEFTAAVKKALKLPDYCAGFELDITVLAKHQAQDTYIAPTQFPKIQQDITLEVAGTTSYQDILDTVQAELIEIQVQHGIESTVLPHDIFKPEDSDKKRVSLRIWMYHPARTLTTDETNRSLDAVANACKAKLSAGRI